MAVQMYLRQEALVRKVVMQVGFIGEMRNSYAVDCSISSLGTVSGKDYTGGFAGLATLGAVTSIDENKGLLDLVKKLLTGLLNGNITDMDILNLVDFALLL